MPSPEKGSCLYGYLQKHSPSLLPRAGQSAELDPRLRESPIRAGLFADQTKASF
jgi:hypothetical protein